MAVPLGSLSVLGVLVIVNNWGGGQDKKKIKNDLSAGKILDENLVQSAFHQTMVR